MLRWPMMRCGKVERANEHSSPAWTAPQLYNNNLRYSLLRMFFFLKVLTKEHHKISDIVNSRVYRETGKIPSIIFAVCCFLFYLHGIKKNNFKLTYLIEFNDALAKVNISHESSRNSDIILIAIPQRAAVTELPIRDAVWSSIKLLINIRKSSLDLYVVAKKNNNNNKNHRNSYLKRRLEIKMGKQSDFFFMNQCYTLVNTNNFCYVYFLKKVYTFC